MIKVLVELTETAKYLQRNLPNVNFMPKAAHPTDAGFDVKACIPNAIELHPLQRMTIPTGIKCELPDENWEIQVRPRSGLADKQGFTILNSPGTIDYEYRGEIKIILFNSSPAKHYVHPGDRIAQLCVRRVPAVQWEEVEKIDKETYRGEGGFGSTGS